MPDPTSMGLPHSRSCPRAVHPGRCSFFQLSTSCSHVLMSLVLLIFFLVVFLASYYNDAVEFEDLGFISSFCTSAAVPCGMGRWSYSEYWCVRAAALVAWEVQHWLQQHAKVSEVQVSSPLFCRSFLIGSFLRFRCLAAMLIIVYGIGLDVLLVFCNYILPCCSLNVTIALPSFLHMHC